MTVEKMDKIVRCLVILHNTYVKERLEKEGQISSEEDSDTGRVLDKEKLLMWGGIVRFSTFRITSLPGSVTALCEVKNYMEEETENALKKRLISSHIWNNHGEEF